MASTSDPPLVGRDAREHLRRFVAARAAGDAGEMRRCWELLLTDTFDRIRGMVAVEARRAQLTPTQREDAMAMACRKIWENLVLTFAGSTPGELNNAMRVLVHNICVDVQRKAIRERRREVSLEDLAGSRDDDATRYDRVERDAALARQEADETARDHDAFFEWALPQLPGKQAVVMRRTLEGVPAGEIVEELGVTTQNVYKLRERGSTKLAMLKEQYDR